jgi:hypothetical protein
VSVPVSVSVSVSVAMQQEQRLHELEQQQQSFITTSVPPSLPNEPSHSAGARTAPVSDASRSPRTYAADAAAEVQIQNLEVKVSSKTAVSTYEDSFSCCYVRASVRPCVLLCIYAWL